MAGRSLTAKIRVGSVGIAALLALSVAPAAHAALVINEVDYDQPGADNGEFVEIYNNGTTPEGKDNRSLIFVTANAEYARAPLGTGTIPADGYLVMNFANTISNAAPSGIGLYDTSAHVGLDSLSWGGTISNATITDETDTALTESIPTSNLDSDTRTDSLIRSPNGLDTNNNNYDLFLATQAKAPSTITPGGPNPEPPDPYTLPIVGLPPAPSGGALVATAPRKKCPKHKRLKRGRCVKKKK